MTMELDYEQTFTPYFGAQQSMKVSPKSARLAACVGTASVILYPPEYKDGELEAPFAK